MPYKNEDIKKQKAHKRYLLHRDKIIARSKKWAIDNREKVNIKNNQWKKNNPDKVKQTHINYKNKYQKLIFEHYGNKCNNCGSTVRLHIDHINNNGAEYRKKYKGQLWVWIVRHNFPLDLQILCQLCNERKKRAFVEGITLKKWEQNFNNKIETIKGLKEQGLSYNKISIQTGISLSNVISLYRRYVLHPTLPKEYPHRLPK